jgi:cytochrome c biogenesis protein CcmG/thiol:disulfide interchange protein DsbE
MHAHQSDKPGHGRPLRAERRAAERAAARARSSPSTTGASRLPFSLGLLIVVAALAVFGYAVLRGQQNSNAAATGPSTPHAKSLVKAAAFNPSFNLLKVGSTAPNFQVHDTTGDVYTLREARGHPVLLEFFAVWCPVCHRETPVIHRLAATYTAKGVRVLAILANPYGQNYEISQGKDRTPASSPDLNWYRHTYNVNYPLLVDSRFTAVNRYGASSYPTLYVIDPRGKITYANQGAIPYAIMARQIERASSGRVH